MFDDFPKYGTSLRRLLGIRSEQALELFHQTVSMKSVGNLNDFVRDHMLEPSDASGRVRDIIGHFEDLTKAHDAVKRAREQLDALEPVVTTAAKYDAALAERDATERDRDAVRLFIAELRSGLFAAEIAELDAEDGRLRRELVGAREQRERLTGERESLIEERARAGGDRIGELERLIRDARARSEQRRDTRTLFDAAVAGAGLDAVADRAGFVALADRVADERPLLAEQKRALDNAAAEAFAAEKELAGKADRLTEELHSLEQRTSNLPSEQVELRDQLCHDLGLTTDDLPYAGELLDVQDEHAAWRGAAERVLRGFALSLLVPQQHYRAVTDWVNGNRLSVRGRNGRAVGARLVYERVPDRRVPLQRDSGGALLLADCLEVKEGPFASYLLGELGKRADHRCAATLSEFRNERRAVTQQGQVRSGDRHEKDDRHRVDDPRRWVLGWANERKIAALRTELDEVETQREAASTEATRVATEREAVQSRVEAFARLEGYRSWEHLDVAEATARAEEYAAEHARLTSGSSRLAEITTSLERNAAAATTTERQIESLTGEIATNGKAAEAAERGKRRDDELIGAWPGELLPVARSSYDSLTARLDKALPARAEDCAAAETGLTGELTQRIERLGRELGGYGQSLGQAMGEVLRRWPELRADMDPTVDSRADFVSFRDRVANDDLPRFEKEFKDQLNEKTIQEVAGFNNWLNRQAGAIDERVDRINEALGAVPYNPGRYIRLEKEQTVNQEVAQFRSELRNLTNDSLVIDGDQYSEQRFLDVQRIIERFRGRDGFADSDKAWTRRVTDVRNWFVFSASERDVESGEEWEHYSDSDGKSGGQKEKLAYTILAASLAYQFGLEWGVTRSKDFRFAVIDEAFGRGSNASTRFALELFAKLGLQLLIVTPLQKVQVIEPYVKAIGFVDNPTGTFSRLQTMTIEDYRSRRDGSGR